jgi:nucleoside-diphosphate-sugar epimerase
MRVLGTGANGFIGAALIDSLLLQTAHEVIGACRVSNPNPQISKFEVRQFNLDGVSDI